MSALLDCQRLVRSRQILAVGQTVRVEDNNPALYLSGKTGTVVMVNQRFAREQVVRVRFAAGVSAIGDVTYTARNLEAI